MKPTDILILLPNINNEWAFAAFIAFLAVWGFLEYHRDRSRRSNKE